MLYYYLQNVCFSTANHFQKLDSTFIIQNNDHPLYLRVKLPLLDWMLKEICTYTVVSAWMCVYVWNVNISKGSNEG